MAMRRMCSLLVALALSLTPAVWARQLADYPGWAGEIALRAAGCQSISARISGWVLLTEGTAPATAAAAAEQLMASLGFSGQATETEEYVFISGLRAGAVATVQALLRDARWFVVAEVTSQSDGAGWYNRLGRALSALGPAGAIRVSTIGLRPGRLDAGATALLTRTLCAGLLARDITTVTDGAAGLVTSGTSALLPGVATDPTRGGSFAISLNYSESERATIITVGVPGLH
ncbi:MAG: hypothetical protein ACM3XN_03900 [Chloroflexota bacterium]